MRVVIIDSGTDNSSADGIHFFYDGDEIKCDNDIKDCIGHGTAIHNIILKHNNTADCFMVKIFDSEKEGIKEELFIYALEYIYNNVECSILNLSLGIRICEKESYLNELCKKLREKGVVIVSAFDNEGAVSYPAINENVIGVLSSENCNNPEQIIWVNNRILNVLAYGKLQRVKWLHEKNNMVQGNSFACAHVSGILSNCNKDNLSFVNALDFLRSQCTECLNMDDKVFSDVYRDSFDLEIKHAAVFPFNKEIHSLLLFQDLLPFEIEGVYDTKYSMLVGTETERILKKKCLKNYKIKNGQNINWEEIDTIIVGHIGKIIKLTHNREYFYRILLEANSRGKLIYSFDNLEVLFPEIDFYNLYSINKLDNKRDVVLPNGMLYSLSRPVLEVCGTSSRQGKFTLQLILRRLFLKHGYKVGQLGTEPSALLFGMDDIFHCGYDNSIDLDSYQTVALLNYKLHEIEKNNPDIIITGAQGNVLMDNPVNLRFYTFSQTDFLLGTMPDAILLCVNTFDEIDEIKRNIAYLEAVIFTKIIAIVVFPKKIVNDKLGNPKIVGLDMAEYESQRKMLWEELLIRAFILGDENDMEQLFDVVVNYFSEGE